MRDIHPDELRQRSHNPCSARLLHKGPDSSKIAERFGLIHRGPNRQFSTFDYISRLNGSDPVLCYIEDERHQPRSMPEHSVVITTSTLARKFDAKTTLLLSNKSPAETFYTIINSAVESGHVETLVAGRHPTAWISPSAVVSEHCYVDCDAQIGPGAVVLPNSYIGPRVVIKPNAVIGGDGFETSLVRGRRSVVKHAGGVWLSEGVEIGSGTCVDKGLFGELTFLGSETKVDNLVHIAHGARVGQGVSIVACAEISGSCIIEDRVWIGPRCAVNQGITIGADSYIGTGSVVVRNIHRHTLAYGSPAKWAAWVCCKKKLDFQFGRAKCACGRSFRYDDKNGFAEVQVDDNEQ